MAVKVVCGLYLRCCTLRAFSKIWTGINTKSFWPLFTFFFTILLYLLIFLFVLYSCLIPHEHINYKKVLLFCVFFLFRLKSVRLWTSNKMLFYGSTERWLVRGLKWVCPTASRDRFVIVYNLLEQLKMYIK